MRTHRTPATAGTPGERAGLRVLVRRVDVWVPAAYLACSAAWISTSDLFLSRLFPVLGGATGWSVAKGLGFVLVTAVALHLGLRRALADERAAFDALHASDERKSAFIAMLSHELRNPLAPLRHALWLLDRVAPDSEQATGARATLARQVAHLSRLTDDLLDVNRISHGRIQLQRTRVDVVEIVRRAVEDHAPLFASRQVTLDAELPEVPLRLDADATRLGQVFGNVLWNAAKFTEPGGRTVVRVERQVDGQVLVRVRDDGIGIPAEILPHVFDSFFQADRSLDRTRGGLGLGLSLVKTLVELHGGSVQARSEGTGKGAELSVRLPLAPEEPALARPSGGDSRDCMPRHRVLVVEDNVDAAETLREMLLLWNHEVEVAHDGQLGIERARTFQPDVVLCDIGLPGMDGYDVARAMRADPAISSAFLVAVTGYASPEDARRAVGAGFDRHLGKPVPIELLEEVLATAPTPRAAASMH